MSLLRLAIVLGLAFAVAAAAPAAGCKKKGRSANNRPGVRGVVAQVDKNAVRVEVRHGKKGAAQAAPAEEVFQLTARTRFVRVVGTKGQRQRVPARRADLKEGEHVVILTAAASPRVAQAVMIVERGPK